MRDIIEQKLIINRKGSSKSKLSIVDIVKIFLEMEMANITTFAARNHITPNIMIFMLCI